MRAERRLYQRYPVTGELRGKGLRPLERAGDRSLAATVDLRGAITDISAGGVSIFADDMVGTADLFLCEIIPPQMPVGIPTLLQVRWVLKDGQGHTYRVGLQYLV